LKQNHIDNTIIIKYININKNKIIEVEINIYKIINIKMDFKNSYY
jgi:hypothetical protein